MPKTKTKRPTPLSTYALAAFLTWKQFDLLLLLKQEGSATTTRLSGYVIQIQEYDVHHGGAFYTGVSYVSLYSSLRTLETRQLVRRHIGQDGFIEWTLSPRGEKALELLEQTSGVTA
jgi:DNA-binding MarR family transcriptional regulator